MREPVEWRRRTRRVVPSSRSCRRLLLETVRLSLAPLPAHLHSRAPFPAGPRATPPGFGAQGAAPRAGADLLPLLFSQDRPDVQVTVMARPSAARLSAALPVAAPHCSAAVSAHDVTRVVSSPSPSTSAVEHVPCHQLCSLAVHTLDLSNARDLLHFFSSRKFREPVPPSCSACQTRPQVLSSARAARPE